jgi:hypothetical protein
MEIGELSSPFIPQMICIAMVMSKDVYYFLWTSKYQKLKQGIDLLGVNCNNSLLYMCHFWSNKSLCNTWSKKFVSVGSIMTTIKVQTHLWKG